MPELPINTILPNKDEVESRIKWMTFLQGGGLSILISVIGLGLASTLFYFLMNNYKEDRAQMRDDSKIAREADSQFREQMLKATVEHTVATTQQTETQKQTNEIMDETKDAIVSMSNRFEEVADKIEDLSSSQKHTGERLDRILEKAWNDVKQSAPQQPQPTPK